MASTLVGAPFHRPGWVFEEKYDGWRMLAFKDGARVRLISRQGVDHTARFRELATAVAQLRAPELVLDGEVCVFDEDLVSQFHLLGRPDPTVVATPPVLMAFDCLRVLGVDVRGLPLHRRRAMLEEELVGAHGILPARRLADHGHAAWAIVKERGYEGLVGKDPESAYRAGTSRAWLKLKVRHEGAFAIGGIANDGGHFRGCCWAGVAAAGWLTSAWSSTDSLEPRSTRSSLGAAGWCGRRRRSWHHRTASPYGSNAGRPL